MQTLDDFLNAQSQQKELTLEDILTPPQVLLPNQQYQQPLGQDSLQYQQPLVQESLHYTHPIQINVQQDNSVFQTQQLQNPMLLSPGFPLQVPARGRSDSIGSSGANSISFGLDGLQLTEDHGDVGSDFGSDWGSDFGSNYGAQSPFPGAQVVQVPSPWIKAINSPGLSPTGSPISSPTVDQFSLDAGNGIQYVGFDDYLSQFINPQQLARSPSPQEYIQLNQDYRNQLSQSPQASFLQQNMANKISQSPQASFLQQHMELQNVFSGYNLTPTNSTENLKPPEKEIETAVPDGKFWNLIKKDGQTLYQCPWENCAFTRPYNLKSHYRGHIGEKPFRCDIPGCESSFARKHDLKRHILSHSDDRRYKCTFCGKAFTRHDALARHLKPADGKESHCPGRAI